MKAVRKSKLPAPARHVMLTLASLADQETAVVPDQYTPSLSELAEMTGLGRSTVAAQLNLCEEQKWVERDRPTVEESWSKKAKTRYKLRIGTSPGAGLVQERDQSRSGTSPGAGLADQSETDSPGAGLVQERDSTSPGAGHELLSKSTPSKTSKASRSRTTDDRPDVDEICEHLAHSVETMLEAKRPTVTKEWRAQARLLLDEPRPVQPTVERVKALIDWAHKDAFWRRNVLSMPTLRKQYDRIRLAAVEDFEASRGRQARTDGRRVSTAEQLNGWGAQQ
jgi:hypothetical protein